MEIKNIALSKLVENPWNPNVMNEKKFAVLVSHVQKKGMVQPILVRPLKLSLIEKSGFKEDQEPEFEIIDGAHRFRAAKQAGLKEMNCVIVEFDDEHAKMATIAMNNIKGYMQEIPLANLVDQLSKTISLEELSQELAFEERELKSYLKMLEAPEDFSTLVEHPEDRPVTLTFVLWPKQEKIISEALDKTGIDSKAHALATICKRFLDDTTQ